MLTCASFTGVNLWSSSTFLMPFLPMVLVVLFVAITEKILIFVGHFDLAVDNHPYLQFLLVEYTFYFARLICVHEAAGSTRSAFYYVLPSQL